MEWFKTREIDGKLEVFDPIRKKYYFLSPEEEVRQITLHWLVEKMKYPAGLIAVEFPFVLNKMKKRSDIVVFSREGKALIIVECKARHIPVTQKVMDQAVRYNMKLQVNYLMLTNTDTTYFLKMDRAQQKFIQLYSLPPYDELDRT